MINTSLIQLGLAKNTGWNINDTYKSDYFSWKTEIRDK